MTIFVKDIMQTEVKVVSPRLSLLELERRFADEKVSGFPVVDEGKIVGVVSVNDVIRGRRENGDNISLELEFYQEGNNQETIPLRGSPPQQRATLIVRDVMSTNVIRIDKEAELKEVAGLMTEHRVHRVLVTDNDRLVGIISALKIAEVCGYKNTDISFQRPTLDF